MKTAQKRKAVIVAKIMTATTKTGTANKYFMMPGL
jgi:hypothetical protein